MPAQAIIASAIVTGVIAIFPIALAYGQRQTTAYHREHPEN
jgi:hypothetical protein